MSPVDFIPASNERDAKVAGPVIIQPSELEVAALEVRHSGDGASVLKIKEDVQEVSHWLIAEYDFADLGGAVSSITLTDTNGDAITIPDDAIVLNCYTECLTAATSGGAATIALGVTGNTDAFVGATAYTDNGFDTVGTIAARTSELPLKMSAAVSVLATVATAALTAGKFRVHINILRGVA